LNTPVFSLPSAGAGGRNVTQQALEAQSALLPYALGVFGVGLPIFVWVGSHAVNPQAMAYSLATFAVGWGLFYGAVTWIRKRGRNDVRRRALVHLGGGFIWVGAILQITLFAMHAGPAQGMLLGLAVAAAVVVTFFTAPWLLSLLTIGPAAAAAPLIALWLWSDRATYSIGITAYALALALALVMNQMMRRQFQLAAERETLIGERAAMLTEAERLARSKSDLVATLSHEIRNGLAGVAYVLAGAAGRSARAAPSREQLSAALDATNDLISVLNTTLDSETAEAGRLAVETSAFDPVGLVEDVVLLNRPQAQARGLELSLHIAPELIDADGGGVVADPVRTRQILGNLVANAIKYTVRGRVEVRVELVEKSRLLVEVADTGPGLTPDEISQAFEPFARVARTAAGVPGAGLGLSLSRQLARLMGGEVTGEGAAGVGSCFRLTLVYDSAALIGAERSRVDEPSASGRLRILVIEADGLSAAMLRAVLEQLGHQVVQAHDGARAAELSRICDFDLIAVDSRLSEPPAAAVIGDLKNRAPLLAIIGGEPGEAEACVVAGAAAILRRPVSVAGVARGVAEAMATPSRRARAVA
jgi:signal transduction histidine kinase